MANPVSPAFGTTTFQEGTLVMGSLEHDEHLRAHYEGCGMQ